MADQTRRAVKFQHLLRETASGQLLVKSNIPERGLQGKNLKKLRPIFENQTGMKMEQLRSIVCRK